jgi:WD40 repeat protein
MRRLFDDDLIYPSDICFSSDGNTFAVLHVDGLCVWDVPTWKRIRRSARSFHGLHFAPNGKTLASFSYGHEPEGNAIKLVSVRSGKTKQVWSIGENYVHQAAFTADGKVFACALYIDTVGEEHLYDILLWETATGISRQRRFQLRGNLDALYGLRFGPQTQLVAMASNEGFLWDVETGERLNMFSSAAYDRAYSLAASPDNRLLAVGTNAGCVRVYETAAGTLMWETREHTSWVRTIAFSPDGKLLASAGTDHHIHLWHTDTGTLYSQLPGRVGEIWRVGWKASEHIVTAEDDQGNLYLWDRQTVSLQERLQGYIDDAGQVIRATENSLAGIWLFGERQQCYPRCAEAGEGENKVSALLQGGNSVLLKSGGKSRVISLSDEEHAYILTLALSADGRTLATGQSPWGVDIWEVASGKHKRMLNSGDIPLALAFSPIDNHVLAVATAYEKEIGLCNIRRRRRSCGLTGHTNSVRTLTYSSDGHYLLSGAADATVRVWQASTARLLLTLLTFPSGEWIAFTPDGYYDGSPNVEEHLLWRVETELQPGEKYAAVFRRPDRVRAVFNE